MNNVGESLECGNFLFGLDIIEMAMGNLRCIGKLEY